MRNDLGGGTAGTADAHEAVAAVSETTAGGAGYQAYYDGFWSTASRLAAQADADLAAGHLASARAAYLRAASYYDLCLYFVLGTRARAHEAGVYAVMQRCWNRATRLLDPPGERVHIPYGSTWLPGYLLRPAGPPARRPTVILNNGSDGQNVDLFAFGGAAALDRGWNALIFEGPGQGSLLFERKIFFRPDWERVITPVVDWLTARPDVDPRRIALTGWGMCGASVIRAAAFERRLAAVVADPGVTDAWLAFPPVLRGLFVGGAPRAEVNGAWNNVIVPALTASQRCTLAKRSELFGLPYLAAARAGQVFTDLHALGTAIMAVSCERVAALVTAPVLVTAYQEEMFYPGQAQQLYGLLPPWLLRALHTFTTAEGALVRDAPAAPRTRNQVVFDWLDATLG